MPDTVEDLERAVTKMRALGVTEWNGIKLGPEPVKQTDDTDQPSGVSADERARQQRAERQRVAMLATGGPKPRVVPK
jgi:hypothetical protein